MLHSLSLPSFTSSSNHNYKTLNSHNFSQLSNPNSYLKFRTTHQENVHYLKAIGIINPKTKPHQLPSPDSITQIINTINFFKSKGFEDTDFSKLTSVCPQLLFNSFEVTDIDPVFEFLNSELNASFQESRGFITNCPELLFSDVEHCLKPSLDYLRKLRVAKLNVPSKANAYLLNTRVEKLRSKVKFMRSVGLSHEEASSFCARVPAIFRYSIEFNLRPKLEFLLKGMGRSMEELKEFPQYFGFSLRKRIVPRHLHLKQRDVRIKLNRMLMWSDQRFYTKWK
ncbi:transcription termination factor MTEF1, chloroplastic [Mercurialis annua]|uniref:transcription termination factor MTEF1, chloroplastic n=1 Tax=Mercurialis annua TaxID=3986 RepID=UPI00215E697C|nr:transcription termination factor MTEF1, chloroplastic [Mercurialis annua]